MWNKKHFALALLLLIALCAFGTADAARYNLLAPLPGGDASVDATSGGFQTYMAQLFWFILWGAIILALVMFVIGGVEYVGSAGNTSLLQDAKGRITNALLGLVLALAAWLILYTINPDLVIFELPIEPITLPISGNQKATTDGEPPPIPPPLPPPPNTGGPQPPPPPPPPPLGN
ncbi:MAG: histone-lysine N-methyltransferase SETD1 [Parcubacteria group bacterium Gr01-1014_29]|nr:MAG: histone-lysine N-methyltransferase SETD1 [Parcubacteria group bacterium Gr01-1014_29]